MSDAGRDRSAGDSPTPPENSGAQPSYPGDQYPAGQSPQVPYPGDPYSPPASYPQPSHSAAGAYPPPPPEASWGQPGYYPPSPYQMSGYGSPYSPTPGPARTQHPSAVTAMVLGILGLVGLSLCIGAVLGPIAWWLGSKSVNEIDASGGYYTGRTEANAGRILGIITTILGIIGAIFIAAAIVIDANAGSY